jgi:hypothetical protein
MATIARMAQRPPVCSNSLITQECLPIHCALAESKNTARDVLVERRERKDSRGHDEDRERDPQLRPPQARGLHAVQNDRRVSMRSCMLSMSLL